MTSVLEIKYVEPARPYSQKELRQERENLRHSLRLGKLRAYHKRCDHFYLARQNGRKEKEMLENKSADVGNCSVCWKLGKMSNGLKNDANGLVQSYSDIFYDEPKCLTYGCVDVENVYYRWLYED